MSVTVSIDESLLNQPPAAATLPNLQRVAGRLVELDTRIGEVEKLLKEMKAESTHLRIKELPRMMAELSLTLIGVGNRIVEIETKVQASLPKDPEPREKAINWLHANGYGGIIRRSVTTVIPDDLEIQEKAMDALKEQGLVPEAVYFVHHQTYAANARRIVSGGVPAPLETLGIFVQKEAVVK